MSAPQQQEILDIQDAIDRMTLGVGHGAAAPIAPAPLAFQRLVVATDGSGGAEHAIEWVLALAPRFGSRVHVVTVVTPPSYTFSRGGGHTPPAMSSPDIWDRLLAAEKEQAQAVLDRAVRKFAAANVKATSELAIGSPVERITSIAEEGHADLILIGSYGSNAFERLLIGSTADGVKQHAGCSVLIAKGSPPPRGILLPTDGSEESRSAVLTGVRLADVFGCEATILHVVPSTAYGDPMASRKAHEQAYRELHGEALKPMKKGRVKTEVRYGSPAKAIQERTEKADFGLVVMGSRGLSGLRSRLAGSVSNPVSHRVACSVLLVKDVEALSTGA